MFTAIVLTFVTIAVFSAQTYAYFTDTGAGSMNQIYAGGLDIELVRIQEAGEEQVSYTAPVKFMPATEIAKTVKVKNTGSLPVYIRIRVKKAISNTENEKARWLHRR